MPRLFDARFDVTSSMLDKLAESPLETFEPMKSWTECSEESRLRFVRLHPKLYRICIGYANFPCAYSTAMLASLPDCRLETLFSEGTFQEEMRSSIHHESSQIMAWDKIDNHRVKMLTLKDVGVELIKRVAEFPNLLLVHLVYNNMLRDVKAVQAHRAFFTVARVRFELTSCDSNLWACFPNLRALELSPRLYFVALDLNLMELAHSCPLLEELYVPVLCKDIVESVLQMANLHRLHLRDAVRNWSKCRDILAQLGRKRPLLHVCVCSAEWPCGHPWFPP